MRAERKTALEVSVFSALLFLHERQMPDKDMPQRGKIRYAR